jgi:hypothetical protein
LILLFLDCVQRWVIKFEIEIAIEENTSAIEENTSAIVENTSAIEENTSAAIDENTSAIEENTSAIVENTSAIEKNTSTAIDENTNAIVENTSAIVENTSAIEQDTRNLEGDKGENFHNFDDGTKRHTNDNDRNPSKYILLKQLYWKICIRNLPLTKEICEKFP